MILVFSGPSGIGKDTVWIPAAERLGFVKRLMHTTRERRPCESNGVDYHFVGVDRFKGLLGAGRFAEWDYYFGAYYGIADSILEEGASRDVALHSVVRMAYGLRRSSKFVHIVSLLPQDVEYLHRRLEARGFSGDELVLRRYHIEEEISNSFLCDSVFLCEEDVDIEHACEVLGRLVSDLKAS